MDCTYGGVEGPPHIFQHHRDDLVIRPYEVATIAVSYGRLTNSSV